MSSPSDPVPVPVPTRPGDEGVWPPRPPKIIPAVVPAGADPWLSFNSEAQGAGVGAAGPATGSGTPAGDPSGAAVSPRWPFSVESPARKRDWSPFAILGLLTIAVASTVTAAVLVFQHLSLGRVPSTPAASGAIATATGTANVTSSPVGAEVTIDGVPRGVTPLRLTLPAGEHRLRLGSGEAARGLPLTIEAGAVVSQHVDLPATAPVTTGQLEVTSDPPGSLVSLDGTLRGVTPLVLTQVSAGPHTVVVASGASVISRPIQVPAGGNATVAALFVRGR